MLVTHSHKRTVEEGATTRSAPVAVRSGIWGVASAVWAEPLLSAPKLQMSIGSAKGW